MNSWSSTLSPVATLDPCDVTSSPRMKKVFKKYLDYFPWFVDFWYYIVMIIVFIVLAIIFL
jgi:hypothetical protein